MVIYEVNLEVDEAAADDVAAWLPEHIEELLTLPGFVRAEWLEVLEPRSDGRVGWSIRYELESEQALDRYLAEDAPRMRQDGIQRFGGRFTAARRVLRPRPAG